MLQDLVSFDLAVCKNGFPFHGFFLFFVFILFYFLFFVISGKDVSCVSIGFLCFLFFKNVWLGQHKFGNITKQEEKHLM